MTLLPFILLSQVVDPSADLSGAVAQLLLAVQKGQWGLVVSLAVLLLIAGVRFIAAKNPTSSVSTWLSNRWFGWGLNLGASLGGAIGTALLTGQPITAVLVIAALTNALAAAGTWELLKDTLGAPKVAAAQQAGAAAVATIATKADAVAELNKP